MVWRAPSRVVASTVPASVCGMPRKIRTSAKTMQMGSSTKRVILVRSTQKLPMLPHRDPSEAADDGDRDGDAGRGGDEVLHGEPGHLGEMAHRRLAAVVLPVGVGDEGDGGVEGELRRHRGHASRVERQPALQPLERVEDEDAREVEGEQRQRIAEPALLLAGIDAGEAVERALDRADARERCRPGRGSGRRRAVSPAPRRRRSRAGSGSSR